ncbi:hypothetical protein GH733_015956 [Mirounga leonina]|nr:hypothetical protein GH733_015956 [Mirounga leonina]
MAFLIWFSCLCVGQRDYWTSLPTTSYRDKLCVTGLAGGDDTGSMEGLTPAAASGCVPLPWATVSRPLVLCLPRVSTRAGPVSPEQEGTAGA